MQKMNKATSPFSLLRPYYLWLFWLPLLGLILFNSVFFGFKLRDSVRLRKILPFYFQGLKFNGLQDILKNVQTIGYYTDADFSNKSTAGAFSQAQYMLAPVILDLGYVSHEYILFNCTSEKKAMEKIRELGARPLRKNKFGVILARKGP